MREVLRVAEASSPFLGYQPSFASIPYPGVVCLSINDAVLHGTPTAYRLREGDLLSVDCGATLDGWTGDAAISLCVGRTSAEDVRLLERTEWFMAGGRDAYRIDADGWTLRSDDGSRGAHFEHTIAITDHQPRVLTTHLSSRWARRQSQIHPGQLVAPGDDLRAD